MAGEAISKAFTLQNPCPDPNRPPAAKKKRSLPGTPDPDAEVVALSPRALLATNRFLCEICGKGFQRDQNLQLHRRGHNLPWKLRQRSGKEPRKRVYVCPEKGCVHHHPSRALGDLTGIKKHFCRKHGEKKWKCDKCSKRYAVQSDWKAHSKTCGTREYRCDCGTVFSRRDSFITHRAFCDALAEETARISAAAAGFPNLAAFNNPNYYQFTGDLIMRPNTMQPFPDPFRPESMVSDRDDGPRDRPIPGLSLWMGQGPRSNNESMNLSALYADQFASLSNAQQSVPSLFSGQDHCRPVSVPDMSATALLQRAAQIGVTSSVPPMRLHNSLQVDQDGSKFGGLFHSSHPNLSFDLGSSTLENSIDDFNVPNPFSMCSALRQHVAQRDDLGGEITRDFLGVGAQTICSSSISGWI